MRQLGFDNEKYLQLQSQKIMERIEEFGGKLYLEINSRFPAETCHLLTSHELNDAQAFNDYRGLPRFVKATK